MKKVLKKVLPMMFFVVIGASIGFFGATFVEKHISGENDLVTYLLLVLPMFLVILILQIAIHEAGHLIFGLFTGYKFCSYRLFSFCLVRKDGKIVLKRYSLAGTGGQCLMDPPDLIDDKIPVFWYNMGGSAINLITGVIGMVLAVIIPIALLKLFFGIFAIVGFGYALMNGIPMSAGEVDNDGKNALYLGKNKKALKAFWVMMKINALNTDGVLLTQMPKEWFVMPEDSDLNNSLVASTGIFRANRFMYEHDFDNAKSVYEHLLEKSDALPGIYKVFAKLDLLYIEIIGENRKEIVEKYWTKETKGIIKSMKNNPGIIRVKYVYEKSHGMNDEAEKTKSMLDKIEKDYPYPREIEAEKSLMDIYDRAYDIA